MGLFKILRVGFGLHCFAFLAQVITLQFFQLLNAADTRKVKLVKPKPIGYRQPF